MGIFDIVTMLLVLFLSALFMGLFYWRGHSATKGFFSGFFLGLFLTLEFYARDGMWPLLLLPLIDLALVFLLPPPGRGFLGRFDRPDGAETFIKYLGLSFFVGDSVPIALIIGFSMTAVEVVLIFLSSRSGPARRVNEDSAETRIPTINVIESMSEGLGDISRYIVIITIAVGFSNVVQRYAGELLGLDLTNNAFIETQWYLYAAIFLLGFAYILKNQINVRVDFWFAEQPKKRQALIDLIGHILALLPFCLVGLWAIWEPIIDSWGRLPSGEWSYWEVSPDPNGLPRAPLNSLMAVAFISLLYQAIAEVIKLVMVLRGRDELVGGLVEVEAPIRIE